MWNLLTDKREISAAQRSFVSVFAERSDEVVRCRAGYQGGWMPIEAHWNEKLGIWLAWEFQGRDKVSIPRHWNAFGTNRPISDRNMSITCEINFAVQGIEARLEGAFSKDGEGGLHIVHRGGIGGGRRGIGRSSFFRSYYGKRLRIPERGEEREFALVADLESPRLADQVACFVHEVERIKERAVEDGRRVKHGRTPPGSTLIEEPTSRAAYFVSGWREPSADHGIVVNELIRQLRSKGKTVRKDIARDLFFVDSRGRTEALFEVKTGGGLGDVYQAIGQLFYNSIEEPNRPILILACPPLPRGMQNRIKSLGIRVLSYRFKGSTVIFRGIEDYPEAG